MTTSARRRVASNTAVQVAGKVVVSAIALASVAIITRYLGPHDYGRYALTLMYLQLFGVLADVGIYTTVVRDISKQPQRAEQLVGNALTLRAMLAVLAIVVGGLVSLALPYDRDVRLGILIAGGPLLFGMLTTSIAAVLQSRLQMGRAVIGDVSGRAAALALVVLVIALDLGFLAVIAAAAGGALVNLIVVWSLTRRIAVLRPRFEPAVWRRLLAAGLPLGVALAINAIYFRADTLIISIYEPYTQVGLYALAYRILEVVLVIGYLFLNNTLPVLSDAVERDDARARRAIQSSSDVLVVLGVPTVAGGLALAPALVALAGGSDFADAATPLRILLAAGALAWINGIFGFALIAKDRQLSALWLNLIALGFNVGLNLLLVPRYGIDAAAVVTLASELVILAGSYRLMRRHYRFFPVPRTLVPALIAAAPMTALAWLLRDVALPVPLLLGAGVYAVLLYAISARSRELVAGLRRS